MNSYLFQNSNDRHDCFRRTDYWIDDECYVGFTLSGKTVKVLDWGTARHSVHSNMMDGSLWHQFQKSISHSQTTSENRNQSDTVGDFVALAIQMLLCLFLADTNSQWNLPCIQSRRCFVSQVVSHLSQNAAESPRRRFRRPQDRDLVEEDRMLGNMDVWSEFSFRCLLSHGKL